MKLCKNNFIFCIYLLSNYANLIFRHIFAITFTAIYYVCRRAHEKTHTDKEGVIKFCYIDIQNRPNGQEKQIQAKETRHHIQKGFWFLPNSDAEL